MGKKQQKIASEQASFVPESFKQQPSMNIEIQQNVNNDSTYSANSKKQTIPTQQQQQHRQHQNNQQKQQNYSKQQQHPQQHHQKNNMNMNMNNKPIHSQRAAIDQPISEPYFEKKAEDPFAKYLQKNPRNDQKQQIKVKPYSNNGADNRTKNNFQFVPQQQNLINNNNDNQFFCAICGKEIEQEWTEDSQQRKYHNFCFVCCECGISLGSVGKYVKSGKRMTCRSCRDKQIAQKQIIN